MPAPHPALLRLKSPIVPKRIGHPWVSLAEIAEAPLPDGIVASLETSDGQSLGTGIFDRRDPVAAWRRFSWSEAVPLDASYLDETITSALDRRGDEACQRLISNDADYLPGLTAELFEDILTLSISHPVMEAQLELIVEILKERVAPREIVLLQADPTRSVFGLEGGIRTLSGQNLKGSWVRIDDLNYRIDLLRAEKPRFFLDQREQHALVGSLCLGRCVLNAFSHSGAFALQAVKNGAEHVVALDNDPEFVKAIGANAQRNGHFVETLCCHAEPFLAERAPGELDAIILDPPELIAAPPEAEQSLLKLHQAAFRCLAPGGLLATYARSETVSATAFEQIVAQAAGQTGREGRIFARTTQPFDFPSRLNFPESNKLKGLILQVE